MKPSDTTPAETDLFKPPTELIIVTTPFVSGYHVTRVIGATFGLIVRSRGLGQNIFAFFRAWGGGEIKVYTNLLEQVRHLALQRLADHAKTLGANAVVSCSVRSVVPAGQSLRSVMQICEKAPIHINLFKANLIYCVPIPLHPEHE